MDEPHRPIQMLFHYDLRDADRRLDLIQLAATRLLASMYAISAQVEVRSSNHHGVSRRLKELPRAPCRA
jgi:hypothetical protein